MIHTSRHTRTSVTVEPVLFSHPLVEETSHVAGELDAAAARQVRFTAPSSTPARRR
ncbi:hypothetical protein L1857_09995 [Amycolatopsis thermalba]|uniref:Uncharacterized protein n=1 Tax=Amycolatopsis thermalba TaxID=944492 RepID=A0ABY4NST1_9PSEU|nr:MULTISPECIES: hypothetical protein [Amycolatopsis]UQS23125.1 hypothetical protein L1857_09995 [Amycolatopsis thermalba]